MKKLESADDSAWTDRISSEDGLPLRDSGSWIDDKHSRLAYFAHMFSTGMKNKWENRVYLELFSGPGKCYVRDNQSEELGSPLKVIDKEFTKFIFIEINTEAAKALDKRLETFDNSDKVEIWNGDCDEAIDKIIIPKNSLTFVFIDPTGIAQIPFKLIERLHKKTRCDLLINIQYGMGIKMNMHQYKPDADENSALTKFLGHDRWKDLLPASASTFFRGVLGMYKEQLLDLGFTFTGNEVIVNTSSHVPLYLLLFASKHRLGQKFWNQSVEGTDPQTKFDFL